MKVDLIDTQDNETFATFWLDTESGLVRCTAPHLLRDYLVGPGPQDVVTPRDGLDYLRALKRIFSGSRTRAVEREDQHEGA